MRKGRGPNIQFFLQGCCVLYILGCLFILFKFVEILGFDDLVLKCYFFFMSNRLLNIVDHFLNDIV